VPRPATLRSAHANPHSTDAHYTAVEYNAIQYNTIQYNAMPSAVQNLSPRAITNLGHLRERTDIDTQTHRQPDIQTLRRASTTKSKIATTRSQRSSTRMRIRERGFACAYACAPACASTASMRRSQSNIHCAAPRRLASHRVASRANTLAAASRRRAVERPFRRAADSDSWLRD
jgi:hypothetical protein